MAITTVTVEKTTHAELKDLKRELSLLKKEDLSLDDVIKELLKRWKNCELEKS